MLGQLIRVPDEGLASDGEDISPALAERIDHVLIPQGAISERVSALAERICLDYRGTDQLTLMAVLEGARTFAEDLGRAIAAQGGPAVQFDYIKARTYGEQIKSDGETAREVSIMVEPRPVEGKHIVVVEDIVDQGFTLTRIHQLLIENGPASMRTCALLLKRLDNPTPAVRKLRKNLRISYSGFEVPDRWVAGYGIDVSGELRELPYIIAVNESYYSDARAER